MCKVYREREREKDSDTLGRLYLMYGVMSHLSSL